MEKRKLKLAATSFIINFVAADFSLREFARIQPDLVLQDRSPILSLFCQAADWVMNDEAQTSYRDYAKRQVETITEALTEVMLGNFSVVARTSEPDDTFGHLCAMVNVAINAARNAQQELQAKIVELETEVAEHKQAEEAFRESEERLQLALVRLGESPYPVV